MRKIVLDTNCLLMSLPRISPYRKIWDDFLKGKLTLCVTLLLKLHACFSIHAISTATAYCCSSPVSCLPAGI